MKSLRHLLLAISLTTTLANASPVDDGVAAYERGDYAAAMELWTQAAEEGNDVAQFNIGLLYANGLGVEQSYVRAREWYRKAGLQGNVEAQYNLGLMYAEGKGVFRNFVDAASWWGRSSLKEHAPSQYNLGILYAYGYGVAKDVSQAITLWEQAAEGGYRKAVPLLARVYREGMFGIQPDAEKAEYWSSLIANGQ